MEIKSEMEPEIVFGQLYQFIQDETVEEIWINSPERIFVARAGRSELTNVILTAIEVRDLVDRALIWGGRRLDLSHPFVDARLPDGSRLHVTIPEITAEHWAVNIRKHIAQTKSLDQLKDEGVLTPQIMDLLVGAVNAGKNILVSGATQAGKTTLPDVIQMQTRSANLQGAGEISLRRLVKEALRMRPNRLIIGEVREAEALDLLIALNSGLPGMGTIHANSARDAVMKLQTLPLLAGSNISHSFIVPTVASAIDLVVHMALLPDGQRRVQEILEVTGRHESLHIEMESLWRIEDGRYVPGLGLPSFSERVGVACEK
jgi:pilus assembly protein CpaF